MRNEEEKIVQVINLISRKGHLSCNDSDVPVGLKRAEFDKLNINYQDLERIFLLLKQNGQIDIVSDLAFDINAQARAISDKVIKGIFKGKKTVWDDYNTALYRVRCDKEYTRIKKEGDLQIIITNLSKLDNYKSSLEQAQDNRPVHWIKFKNNREILLDGKVRLAKPNLNSENDNFFQFVYDHPNEKLSLTKIEEGVHGKLTKRIINIVCDLGFTGDIKKLFFPAVSDTAVTFMNPISKKYLKDNKLSKLTLDKK